MTEQNSSSTEQYRVVGVGAIYQKPTESLGLDGKTTTLMVPTLAVRGETVGLPPFEAKRLSDLGAVKPADSDLDYDEQTDEDLRRQVDMLGLEVRGTAADETVRREDLINALTIHDQGATAGHDPAATAGFDPAGADVRELAERISSQKLSVDDTVALAGNDPERALRVLEAERVASGDAPRPGVVQGLEKVVDGNSV